MTTHRFEDDLHFEQSKFEIQDQFYYNKLHVQNIERIDFESEEHKELQRKDIDVILTKGDKQFSLSEKHRNKDFGDLLIELYSKFPDTAGWLSHSQADFLAYFVPNKVYFVEMTSLKNFVQKHISPHLPDNLHQQLIDKHPQQSTRKSIKISIADKSEKLTLVQAYNQTNNCEWYTESICCPFDLLKRKGVKVHEIKHVTEKKKHHQQ